MVTVRGEEEAVPEPLDKVPQNGGLGNEVVQLDSCRSPVSLPDLVSRPLQLDVGLREVTLTPGVTLEISLQEDLVMTVRLKQDKSSNSLNAVDSKITDSKAVLEITDIKDPAQRTILSTTNESSLNQSTKSNNGENLNDFSDETKDNLLLNLNKSSSSQIYDETKDKSKSIFSKSVSEENEESQEEQVTKILNGSNDLEYSSSDDEEWTTQNVERSNQRGHRRDDSDSTEEDEWAEIFEDCQDYEEVVTDFGCDYFNNYNVRDSQLQTIMEEEEEDEEEEEEEESSEEEDESDKDETNKVIIEDLDRDNNADKINDILSLIDSKTASADQTCYKSDNSVEIDSDNEKSELEQFEILEQLCSSSSDDFDPEEFCKVGNSNNSSNGVSSNTSSNDSDKFDDSLEKRNTSDSSSPESSNSNRISSFKEYLKRRNSTGSEIGKKKGEYINKLTLVQENDGRAKVKPVDANKANSSDTSRIIDNEECEDNRTNNFKQEVSEKDDANSSNGDGLISYNEWRYGCKTNSDLEISSKDEIFDNKINESIRKDSNSFDRSLREEQNINSKSSNMGALNTILRSKLADKPTMYDEDHNFERKIIVVDQKADEIRIEEQTIKNDNPTKVKTLKSILKTKSRRIDDDQNTTPPKGVLKGILKSNSSNNKNSLSFSDEINYSDESKMDYDSFNDSSSTIEFSDSLNSTFDESNNAVNGSDYSFSNTSNLADVSSCVSFSDDCNLNESMSNDGVDKKSDHGDKLNSFVFKSNCSVNDSISLDDSDFRSNSSVLKSDCNVNDSISNNDTDKSINSGDRSNSFVFKSNNSSIKIVNSSDEFNNSNLDASFEWREMTPVKRVKGVLKRSVNFDESTNDEVEEPLKNDYNGKDQDLNVEAEAGIEGCRVRRSLDNQERMSGKHRIDGDSGTQPQVNIFSSSSDDPAAYDFGSDPWFSSPSIDRTSMRTKKDGSKSSSSSKDTDQSSSTDSNPPLPKSALKKSGKKRKKHKVQFDESLNKFFEADYVILIREDECECGGELCCSSFLQDDEDEDSFADFEEEENSVIEIPEPPIEFVDQLTLSPPDGYKDTCLPETLNFQQQHDGLTGSDEIKSCEDNTTQTTPTSPTLPHSLESLSQAEEERAGNEFNTTGTNTGQSVAGNTANSGSPGDRYIVETITMTTVTERRIVRETLDASHIQPSREELSLRLVRPCTTNKPGSAVRALFPSAVRSPDSEEDTDPLESSLIKRTIERNTLRRSLLKYPGDLRLRRKKQQVPSEESLEEKIRKLTCDIDQEPEQEQRTSPQGQEEQSNNLPQPSYSVSRRLCEVLRKEQHPVALEQQYPSYYESASFLAATAAATTGRLPSCGEHHRPMSAVDLRSSSDLRLLETRPLSAEPPGARDSIATDYSLGDIDEVLGDCSRQVSAAVDCRPGDGRPDVLAGTPDPPDELALFVEQDASRIERIRKRYSNSEEESDDYGFSRRPSVRGIKPTFGSTTEILQRMQSQVGPGWPYYPQTSGLNGCRPGVLTPAPSIRPGCQPLCSAQPTSCPQPNPTVMTAYPQHHPVGGYPPTAYLPYSANGYPPRLYARHDMPLVRATQTPPHYYPRYRVGSPTKGKLEGRIGPEGAASSSHDLSSCDDVSLRDSISSSGIRDVGTTAQNLHDGSSIDSSLMYAMNV